MLDCREIREPLVVSRGFRKDENDLGVSLKLAKKRWTSPT